MKTRLVAIDLDGTLLDTRQRASAGNLAALARVLADGVVVALASARDRASIALKVPLAAPGLFYLASGGGMVVDTDSGATVWDRRLSPAVTREAVALLRCYGHPVLLNSDSTYWVDRQNERVAMIEERYNPSTRRFDEVGDLGVPVHRVTLVAPRAVLERAAREGAAAFGDRASVSLASADWLDILAPDAGKGPALRWLQDHVGVSAEHTMAIGDYDSDLPLFAAAHDRVAMANGVSRIRAQATWQTASNDEDGVARALERLQGPPPMEPRRPRATRSARHGT